MLVINCQLLRAVPGHMELGVHSDRDDHRRCAQGVGEE